jgi:hypothetical protein
MNDGSSITISLDSIYIRSELDEPGNFRSLKAKNHREQVRFQHALNELRDFRLVQDDYKNDGFRCTHLGYEVADEIKKNVEDYSQLEFFQ